MPLWRKEIREPVIDPNTGAPTGETTLVSYRTYQAKMGDPGDIFSGYGEGEYAQEPSVGKVGKLLKGVDVNMEPGDVVPDPNAPVVQKIKDAVIPKKAAPSKPNDPLADAKKKG